MSKRNIINFVEKDVKEYLDNAITCWRKKGMICRKVRKND